MALGRYKAGVGTILDLLTAQAAVALALQARINAEHSWDVSRAQLVLALGRLSGAEPLKLARGAPVVLPLLPLMTAVMAGTFRRDAVDRVARRGGCGISMSTRFEDSRWHA